MVHVAYPTLQPEAWARLQFASVRLASNTVPFLCHERPHRVPQESATTSTASKRESSRVDRTPSMAHCKPPHKARRSLALSSVDPEEERQATKRRRTSISPIRYVRSGGKGARISPPRPEPPSEHSEGPSMCSGQN